MDGGGNEKRMRVIIIAVLLFFLNLSIVMLDILGIFNVNIAAEDQWRKEVDEAKSESFDPDQAITLPFGDFFSGARTFIAMIWRVTLVGETLKLFGIDDAIANTFSLAGAIIYFLGLSQFIAKSNTKGMQ